MTPARPLRLLTAAAVFAAVAMIAVLEILSGAALTKALRTQGPRGAAVPHEPTLEISDKPFKLPAASKPPELASGRSLGGSQAPVQLDLWMDYQCPACAHFVQRVEPQLVTRYIAPGKARLTVKDFAFLGDESVNAAVGARCADRQGRFWPFRELLYANQAPANSGAVSFARLRQFAAALELDGATFSACLPDRAALNAVLSETEEGRRLPVFETPWLLVNGKNVQPVGQWKAVAAAIEEALAAPGR